MRSNPSFKYAVTASKVARAPLTQQMSAKRSSVSQMRSTSPWTNGRSPRGSEPTTSARGRERSGAPAVLASGRLIMIRFPNRVAQAPELVVVQELPGQPVERGADQERSREDLQLLAARGYEGPVQHRAPPARLLEEGGRLLAPQQ